MKNQVPTIEITQNELIQKLMGVEKSTFVHVEMETKVRMNKTNNPFFDKVTKRVRRNFQLGNDYENRVNNNEKKEGLEGTFNSEPSRIGVHISKCVLFNEKSNTHYVQLEPFKEIESIETEYLMDGETIDKVLFQDYLVKVSESKKQVQDRKVLIICPKISNIKKINFGGEKFIVTD